MRTFFLIASLLVAFTGCKADDTVKQGIEGEFCNDNEDDCREGFSCQDGVCRGGETSGITCAQMCARLEECNTGEPNCEPDCRATIQGTCATLPCPWSDAAVESFGRCITEELTCDEARAVEAPQECYRRIPIATDRENRCQSFLDTADACNPGVSTTELRNRCYLLGRTSTDESWGRTEPCVSRIEDGMCAEIEACFNDVFELSPAIELGDGSVGPTVQPLNNASPGTNVDG